MHRSSIAALLILCSAASALHAATTADLVGSWTVDMDATWLKLQAMPELRAVPAEQLPLVKTAFEGQFKTALFQFTADKLAATVNGEKKEESYRLAKTEGDVLFTDDTASDGKVTHSRIEVHPDQLVVTNLDAPTQSIVLKRQGK